MQKSWLYFVCCIVLTNGMAQSYVPQYNFARMKVPPVIPVKAYSFNLGDLRLLNSPFSHAMSMDSAYLLLIKPDRLLYRFYKHAGLPVKDSIYGGWESEGLSGHTLGHYLSACSMMYAGTGNIVFKQKVDYIVAELRKCQLARKTGYVGAVPNEDTIFAQVARGQIKTAGFDLNGGWVPWYTLHKVLAGLGDAYLYCHNKTALEISIGIADWTATIVNGLTEAQRLLMLNCEHGGMNEALANIYAFTGNKKYLLLSQKFHDEFVLGKLAKQIDPMPGKHSNTNVPKAIGCARRYELTGTETDKTIATFFWETIVKHHSYVIGGNSNYEYCGKADSLNDRLSDATCETCNTYNMLKLTRHLFSWEPNSQLMDYYERALYNHILASQNPDNGMMTYFVPLRMGTKKQFSDSFHTFTCCVGSGIENHAKYTEQIYSHDGKNTLFVNLFIPSVLHWKQKKVQVIQTSFIPLDKEVKLIISCKKAIRFIVKIRQPFWLKNKPILKVNGAVFSYDSDNNGYISIEKKWQTGDSITITMNANLYTESMPDNQNRIAFKYGPLVLAGLLGKTMPDPVYGTPVLLTEDKNINNWIKPALQPMQFQMKGTGKPFDVTLVPFYQVYNQYYNVYWDYFTRSDWTNLQASYEAEKKRRKEIDENTTDNFRIGEMQPEREHNLIATEKSYVDDALGRKGREARAGNYFSFDMNVEPGRTKSIMLTYIGDDRGRKFDIKIDGILLATVEWNGGKTGKFYDMEYKIPPELLNNKSKLKVSIEANYGRTAGRIFGVRTIR